MKKAIFSFDYELFFAGVFGINNGIYRLKIAQ